RAADAGVVDQDVDRAELAFDLADHRADRRLVGDIGLDRDSADLASDPLDLLERSRRHRDLQARVCELRGDPSADPATAAGHEGYLSRQFRVRHGAAGYSRRISRVSFARVDTLRRERVASRTPPAPRQVFGLFARAL